jgi:hypothetical protein
MGLHVLPALAMMAVLCGFGLSNSVQGAASEAETQAEIIRGIDSAERFRESNLRGYTVIEHYTISNSHFSSAAEIVVHTTYARDAGKTYQILSRTGPSILKDRVMDRILQEEAIMSRGSARARSLITSANYDMHLRGEASIDDKPVLAIDLTPRLKSPHLLKGKIWVDAKTKTVVRIEGQPKCFATMLW